MKSFFLFFSIFWLLTGFCYGSIVKLNIKSDQEDVQQILETTLVLPDQFNNSEPLNHHWLRHFQKQLPALIRSSLEPYGYFHSETHSTLEQVAADEFFLNLQVSAGAAVRVSRLALALSGAGSELPELEQALAEFPLKEGAVLHQGAYEQGKAQLIQSAVELGFLDAHFTEHQIKVYQTEKKAEISLQLESGVRYHFGQTSFVGASDYPDLFLRRYLSYRPSDFFSHRKLGQTQLNLLNADLFQQVSITPDRSQATTEQMPVKIELKPSPRHRLRPGIGYGTDTGARVSTRYRLLNLFSRGHEVKGDLLVAEKKQALIATYIMPDLRRFDSQTQLRLGYDREQSDSYLSRELFGEAEYQRSFGHHLLGSVFLRLTQEYSKIAQETTHSRMLYPGIRLHWRQVDNPGLPKYGLQAKLELITAQQALLSDTSLIQLTTQVTQRLSLPRQYSLILRLQGGTTWHNDPFRELPASLRFFAGGDRSVRGYRYQELGPKDEDGQVIGGKHLLVANIELEKRFNDQWGGAVFYDVGNAFDNLAEYELEQGAGIGVRRYTPIGPIRLDLARQIGTSSGRWRVHLGIGVGW